MYTQVGNNQLPLLLENSEQQTFPQDRYNYSILFLENQ